MSAPDDRAERAFEAVRRLDFLPRDQRRFADDDRALPIGYGQTNSQPSTVRGMLELLGVQPGERVLDVGCGSAWSTALLAYLVGPDGGVYGVEVVPELVAFGRGNLATYPFSWASVWAVEPGVLGLPVSAPYDRILVSAEAGEVPRQLVEQLRVGGTMVVPVSGRMAVVRRTSPEPGAAPEVSYEGYYRFVPLVDP